MDWRTRKIPKGLSHLSEIFLVKKRSLYATPVFPLQTVLIKCPCYRWCICITYQNKRRKQNEEKKPSPCWPRWLMLWDRRRLALISPLLFASSGAKLTSGILCPFRCSELQSQDLIQALLCTPEKSPLISLEIESVSKVAFKVNLHKQVTE